MVNRNHQPKPQVNYPSAKNDVNENMVTQETSESFRKLGNSPLNLYPWEERSLLYIYIYIYLRFDLKEDMIYTLQETNIFHLENKKIIFKHALSGGYVSSLESRYKG